MDIFDLLALIGGLALFLYGMDLMGESLTLLSGSKLQGILEKLTENKFKAVALGASITAIIQSSSGTTVMVVGLVNSGIMQLRQAIGVIMGANIGTTITAWILSLAGIESSNFFVQMLKPSSFSPILAIIGVVMLMFSKNERKHGVAKIMLGFAILMFGMEMMSDAMKPLAESPEFQELFVMFSNPILGVLAGALLTALIQSSSASVGILQALCATGSIGVASVIPIIMGQNIGTCITAALASIGANRNAKRAAAVHLCFNIIGTILFITGFYLGDFIFDFAFVDQVATPVTIAVIHTTFNVVITAILINFINLLEKLAFMIIPETEEERNEKIDEFRTLDNRLIETPGLALQHAWLLSIEMFKHAETALTLALGLFDHFDREIFKEVRNLEKKIDRYQDRLSSYLLKVGSTKLTERDNQTATIILNSIVDIERISDHARLLSESAKTKDFEEIHFSEMAHAELTVYKKAVQRIVALTLQSYREGDVVLAHQVEPLEEVIDHLNYAVKIRHIDRLRDGTCSIEPGLILTDISTSLERIADHCSNIAVAMIEIRSGLYEAHKYLRKLRKKDNNYQLQYEALLNEYQLPDEKPSTPEPISHNLF